MTVDTHGLEHEFLIQSRQVPTFLAGAVRAITNAILREARAAAPRRGDVERSPFHSRSHLFRKDLRSGNLARATFAEAKGNEGRVSVDEAKAPYAKYVLFGSPAKNHTLALFPDTRPGHGGTTRGTHFAGNPVNDFLAKGLERADITAHVEHLASQAGNLPRLAR